MCLFSYRTFLDIFVGGDLRLSNKRLYNNLTIIFWLEKTNLFDTKIHII